MNSNSNTLSHRDLIPHWAVCIALLVTLIAYIIVCHIWGNQIRFFEFDEAQRIMIRTVLYALAIILFPLTKLLRHILLRLNQTMPGDNPAKQRYLSTVTVCVSLIEAVGFFGLVMFVLGDDFNTLYIFSLLGALGIFLHRPQLAEYIAIDEALKRPKPSSET